MGVKKTTTIKLAHGIEDILVLNEIEAVLRTESITTYPYLEILKLELRFETTLGLDREVAGRLPPGVKLTPSGKYAASINRGQFIHLGTYPTVRAANQQRNNYIYKNGLTRL